MSNPTKPFERSRQRPPRATSALRDYFDLLDLPGAPRASQEPQKRTDSPLAGNANAIWRYSQRIK